MGSPALTWSLAAVSVLVAMVSLARLAAADSGEARFAAGGDLVMAAGMAAMFLPATSMSFGDHGIVWVTVFATVGLGGVVLSVQHTLRRGWRHGRHWGHHVLGSAAMVIMTLAMPGSASGPVLALGTSGHGHGGASLTGMSGHGHSGAAGHGMASAGTQAAASGSASVWRLVLAGLAVYFVLSIAASLWTRFRGADRSAMAPGRRGGRSGWTHRLLALPDAIVVFIASPAVSVWDRTRPRNEKHRSQATASGRRRRRAPGTSPGAALLSHIGMGSTMAAMLAMMAG
ncbi:DUF5134 domain-containing protein [Streptomyces djakartensis]|uniref:DUF5134 domain-containing protein n=1 Tax=Streptomyces djakartensis TaxID=68193 RepID=A0ABQ2ZIT8_9ACTN|nr:DUF5134 domain-containing protein [Streptomyces djakartensis]GGY15009.1 hypothetical protein GCM10010384_20850 [Streptomyces djakartensis]